MLTCTIEVCLAVTWIIDGWLHHSATILMDWVTKLLCGSTLKGLKFSGRGGGAGVELHSIRQVQSWSEDYKYCRVF